MPSLLARRQLVIAVLSAVTLVAAGCGGAESRKARHMAKGQTFLAKGNLEKARIEFRNALQIAPTDSEVRYENGVVDEKLGNVREAAQFYQGCHRYQRRQCRRPCEPRTLVSCCPACPTKRSRPSSRPCSSTRTMRLY